MAGLTSKEATTHQILLSRSHSLIICGDMVVGGRKKCWFIWTLKPKDYNASYFMGSYPCVCILSRRAGTWGRMLSSSCLGY